MPEAVYSGDTRAPCLQPPAPIGAQPGRAESPPGESRRPEPWPGGANARTERKEESCRAAIRGIPGPRERESRIPRHSHGAGCASSAARYAHAGTRGNQQFLGIGCVMALGPRHGSGQLLRIGLVTARLKSCRNWPTRCAVWLASVCIVCEIRPARPDRSTWSPPAPVPRGVRTRRCLPGCAVFQRHGRRWMKGVGSGCLRRFA